MAFEGPPTMRCIPGAALGLLRTKLTDAYGNVVQGGTAHVSAHAVHVAPHSADAVPVQF